MNQARANRTASPLASTRLEVTITDLLAEYELRHRFRNDSAQAIEAIYSFPVPLDAAFLGMQATLGDDTFVAQVMPAKNATREYDDAIAAGDTAVLIEQLEPGMLCVSLGALQAGESGEITLRFAAALGVAGRVARFSLPLVHRPRYGRSRLLENGAYPVNDFAAEHPLDACIRIRGLLVDRPVQCSMRGARFGRAEGETMLDLANALLDQDLVLSFDLGDAPVSSLRRIRDGERSIGVLNFVVPHGASSEKTPRDICLLLDGSGSMQGDAITQSRAALQALASELHDDDRIQVLRFGDTVVPLFRRPLRASSRVRAALGELVHTVNADLGGTDMAYALGDAIEAMNALDGPAQHKVVILVTDGAVHAHTLETIARDAARAGIRIFVVAVGSSAGVDALLPLAAATGATLERAVPAEPIDAGVLRQLQRTRERSPVHLDVDWGGSATALPTGIVYPGDASSALAFFDTDVPRTIRVRTPQSEQTFNFDSDSADDSPAWRAWAGQQAWQHATTAEREAIALRYGLITDETSAVLGKVRSEGEKSDGLPRIAAVAHMVPAGMVTQGASYLDAPAFPRRDSDSGDRVLACAIDGCELTGIDDFSAQSEHADVLPPLSPERIALIELKLLHALFKLLFLDEGEINAELFLAEIDSELRDDAIRHLNDCGYLKLDRRAAAALFIQLSNSYPASVTYDLTEDQEAKLAVLYHS